MQMFSRDAIEDILYHELDGVGNEECCYFSGKTQSSMYTK